MMEVDLSEYRLFVDLGTCQITKAFDWWTKGNENEIGPAYISIIGQIRADSNYVQRLAGDLVVANRLAINLDSVVTTVTDLSRIDIRHDVAVASPQFVADAGRLVLLVPPSMSITTKR